MMGAPAAPTADAARFYDHFWSPSGAALRGRHDTHLALAPARSWLWAGTAEPRGSKLLDIGAGDGAAALELANRGAFVTALDVSRVAVEAIQARGLGIPVGPGIQPASPVGGGPSRSDRHAEVLPPAGAPGGTLRAILGDAESMPFPDGEFDVMTATKVLMHVDRGRFLAEARRVLRPGGRLLLLEPMAGHPLLRIHRALDRSFRDLRCRYPSWAELAALPGFDLRRRRAFFVLGVVALGSRRLQALDAALLSRWPALSRLAWIGAIEAERR
jgi:SAM-dependent methyltransferase